MAGWAGDSQGLTIFRGECHCLIKHIGCFGSGGRGHARRPLPDRKPVLMASDPIPPKLWLARQVAGSGASRDRSGQSRQNRVSASGTGRFCRTTFISGTWGLPSLDGNTSGEQSQRHATSSRQGPPARRRASPPSAEPARTPVPGPLPRRHPVYAAPRCPG